jgi:predicted ATPase
MRSHDALALAQNLSHPPSKGYASLAAIFLHQFHQEGPAAQRLAEAITALASEHGLPQWLAWGTIMRGWALAAQGQTEEGIVQMGQGLAASQTIGVVFFRPYFLALLAETYGKVGRVEEGLTVLAEALELVDKTGERMWEAELYRLKGELSLQSEHIKASRNTSAVRNLEEEAEECFHKAIAIARQQRAKSLELRAVMSASRLWQHHGKRKEAHEMLADIYNWFTEGFDTADLKDAKALLDELSA